MENEKFKSIIINLKDLRKLGLEFDDNMLLDAATKIYNTEIINQSKSFFKNTKPFQGSKSTKGSHTSFQKNPELATNKQIDFLARNNIDHNAETLTKKEAWKLIQDFKDGNNK